MVLSERDKCVCELERHQNMRIDNVRDKTRTVSYSYLFFKITFQEGPQDKYPASYDTLS